jgi:sortase A
VNGEGRIDQLLERGLEALHVGDTAGAQALLRRVLERDPRNAEAWYAMAWTLPTVRGVTWCLEQVLVIDPGHAEAAKFLNQARTSPERFAAQWLESDLRRLDETLVHVATEVSEAEQLADEVERRLAALESAAQDEDRGVGVDVPARLPPLRSVPETRRPPVQAAADLHRGATTRAHQLSALQLGLLETEARLAGIDWTGDDADDRLRALHGELGLLWRSLVRQQRELRSLERRFEVVRERERREAQPGRGWVTVGGRRVSVLAIVLICLGLLLIIAGAIEAYPYVRSRLSSQAPAEVAQAGDGVAWAGPEERSLESEGDADLTAARQTPTSAAASSPVVSPTLQPSAVVSSTPTPQPSPVPLPTATPLPLPPTRLVVPKVGIDAPVVPVSWQAAQGEWEVPAWYAAGWHGGSAGLEVVGNTVLNGHNTTRGEVFRNLYQLAVGDEITVYSGDTAFTYVVAEVLILPELGQPREVRERNASYLLPTEDQRLTLVTCHPYGSLRNRLIVIARPR